MCPASASTATPSGCRQPVTMVFTPDPSGLIEKTRSPLKSRTNNRSVANSVAAPGFTVEELLLAVIDRYDLLSFLRMLPSPTVEQQPRHAAYAVHGAESGVIAACVGVRTALMGPPDVLWQTTSASTQTGPRWMSYRTANWSVGSRVA